MLLERGNAVYGVALNFRASREALAGQFYQDPYKKPPVAPILYVRPRNTWNVCGAAIPVPRDVEAVRMGGTLGIVIGRTACRVKTQRALDYVAGYTVVNDASIPHDSYFRPAIRERCRDGFCCVSPAMAERDALPDPNQVEVRIRVNGELRCRASTRDLVRPVETLIADITEFLTLRPGDILLTGEPHDAPVARAGDRVRVEIDGLPPLHCGVAPE
ncbi:MAG TPA: fumarylacetoacetate hydrolase family protein [Bryobacteraceae bacterium]|nr:fumarylacetoacetate hydrolase family protein [Bryobacteraceae bacterium]HUO32134.1 fumarylacetoacetate hydrolase family protein [Bryobacteraceae bacterium]